MPTTSIICGILLVLIGIAGYVQGMMSDRQSVTALIPAIFGILLFAFGAAARAKENLRKHLMHAAAVVALLGLLATAGRLVPRLGNLTFSAAEMAQIAMALICLVFLILAIKSFTEARRQRSTV